jgi:hypothetical protein
MVIDVEFVSIIGFRVVRLSYNLSLSNHNSLESAGLLIEFACLCQEYICLIGSSVLLHMSSDMLQEHGGFLKAAYGLPDLFVNRFQQTFQQCLCTKAVSGVTSESERPTFRDSDQSAFALRTGKLREVPKF